MRARRAGFTLVELMIVVAIIGILAAIGSFGYRRWIGRARLTEAVTMLAEMNSKEQTYRMEFGTYLPLRADGNVTLPSPDEAAAAFYPTSPAAASFESVRTSVSVANSAAVAGELAGDRGQPARHGPVLHLPDERRQRGRCQSRPGRRSARRWSTAYGGALVLRARRLQLERRPPAIRPRSRCSASPAPRPTLRTFNEGR